MNIYYILPFLFFVTTAIGQTNPIDDCLFEGRVEIEVKVKNQSGEKVKRTHYYTFKDSIFLMEGYHQLFYSMVVNCATHHSKTYFKDGRFRSEIKPNKPNMHPHTFTKLEGKTDTILGYFCQAYELKIEHPATLEHQYNHRNILWIAADLNSCIYDKYKYLGSMFANPANKIALRMEIFMSHNGVEFDRSTIYTISKLQREEITEDIWVTEENSKEYEEFLEERLRVKEQQWRLNQEIGTDFTIDE